MKKIAAIIAGGRSLRMGEDKATLMLKGRRLIDHVYDQLKLQADEIVISGPQNYDLPIKNIIDKSGAIKGPAAALFALHHWMKESHKEIDRFFTVPVDGPFLPEDLIARLNDAKTSAVAAPGDGVHPTFACWRVSDLEAAFEALTGEASISLKAIAEKTNAQHVSWPDQRAFFNINRKEDLKTAERL